MGEKPVTVDYSAISSSKDLEQALPPMLQELGVENTHIMLLCFASAAGEPGRSFSPYPFFVMVSHYGIDKPEAGRMIELALAARILEFRKRPIPQYTFDEKLHKALLRITQNEERPEESFEATLAALRKRK